MSKLPKITILVHYRFEQVHFLLLVLVEFVLLILKDGLFLHLVALFQEDWDYLFFTVDYWGKFSIVCALALWLFFRVKIILLPFRFQKLWIIYFDNSIETTEIKKWVLIIFIVSKDVAYHRWYRLIWLISYWCRWSGY